MGFCDIKSINWLKLSRITSEAREYFHIVFEAIEPSITEEMNDVLIRIPEAEKVKVVVFDINSSKAPWPYGFMARFLQTCWDFIGADIVTDIRDFFISGSLSKKFNEIHIKLILKGTSQIGVADYDR